MFETFDVPAIYLGNQGVLAIYSKGRTTGVAVDCGDSITHSVPVYQGYNLPHAILQSDVAGRTLTDYMTKLLKERGHDFNTHLEKDFVIDMKERRCYLALDFNEELHAPQSAASLSNEYYSGNTMELPDGQVFTIENERFQCPEALFQPSLIGRECFGVHQLTYNSIKKVDICVRKDLFNNIVLVGGSGLFPGFSQRLKKEVTALAPVACNTKVIAPSHVGEDTNKEHSVWNGGSILASLSSFQEMWMTKTEYDECGPNIVHKKCF